MSNRALFTNTLLLANLLLAACNQKPGTPESDEGVITEAHQVPEASAKANTLRIIPDWSKVTWIGANVVENHNGTIGIKEGNLKLNNRKIEGGTITIDMTSLRAADLELKDEDNKKLTGHLLSPDFFDAARYPTAEFVITRARTLNSVQLKDEVTRKLIVRDKLNKHVEKPTHEITGNLTIKGITHGISFPARVHFSQDTVRAQANFMINRSDWKLNYNSEKSLGNKMIYNEMNIGLDIAAAR